MSGWQRSRELTAATYGLVQAERDLKTWSIKALVYGVGFGALGVVPGAVILAIGAAMGDETGPSAAAQTPESGAVALMVVGAVLIVLGWIAGATAASLQMAGLVAATDDLLHDRPVDTAACRARAPSRRRWVPSCPSSGVTVAAASWPVCSGDCSPGWSPQRGAWSRSSFSR